MEQMPEMQQQPKNNKWGVLRHLLPFPGYRATPVIIALNILVYVIMISTGISPIFPQPADMITWGAMFKPLIIEGEQWRLLTSMWLHYGIIHLAFNMYALWSIGRALEPLIGTARFSILYILAGLGGSAASLWYHTDPAVGAGASGAVFGVYGIFGSLLTTNLIDRRVRKELLSSIGMFIGYNLLFGLTPGIDNAAHIGGLLAGAIGGYLSYFDLKHFVLTGIQRLWGAYASAIVIIGLAALLYFNVRMPVDPDKVIQDYFALIDQTMQAEQDSTLQPGTEAYKTKIVDQWKSALEMVSDIPIERLKEQGKPLVLLIDRVANEKYKAAWYNHYGVAKNDRAMIDSATIWTIKANAAVMQLDSLLSEMK